jgi:hypothetical protein
MSDVLVIFGCTFLAMLVGFALGVRYTAHRYQRTLREVGTVTAALRRISDN